MGQGGRQGRSFPPFLFLPFFLPSDQGVVNTGWPAITTITVLSLDGRCTPFFPFHHSADDSRLRRSCTRYDLFFFFFFFLFPPPSSVGPSYMQAVPTGAVPVYTGARFFPFSPSVYPHLGVLGLVTRTRLTNLLPFFPFSFPGR